MKKCVLTGDKINKIGSMKDLVKGRVDGSSTNLGFVGKRARNIYQYLVSFITKKSQLNDFLEQNNDFVPNKLREQLRDKISMLVGIDKNFSLESLTNYDLYYDENDSNTLRKLLLEGVDQDGLNFHFNEKGALTPMQALCCIGNNNIREEERTFKFIRALLAHLTVLSQKPEYKDKKLELVDAGTGPVPLFGLIAALYFDNVNSTCIELNAHSAEFARRFVKLHKLEDRITIKEADAITYQHEKEIDFLVTETMFSGLTREPMIQIMNNLSKQLVNDGKQRMMPEKIHLGYELYDESAMESKSKIDFLKDPIKIGDIITIDENNLDLVDTNGFRFKIDVSNIQGDVRVAVFTTVDLFESEKLNPIIVYRHDSTISRPNLIGEDEFIDVNEQTDLIVSYMPGEDEKNVHITKNKTS